MVTQTTTVPGQPMITSLHNVVLELHVMEAEWNKKRGIFGGFSNDPYVKVRVGTNTHKTKIYKGADRSVRASWFEKFQFTLQGM